MASEDSDDELQIAGGHAEATHPAASRPDATGSQQREDPPTGAGDRSGDSWLTGPAATSSQDAPAIKYTYASRIAIKLLSGDLRSQYQARASAINQPRVEGNEGIAVSKPKRDRYKPTSNKDFVIQKLGESSDDDVEDGALAPSKKARRTAKSTDDARGKHHENIGSVHDDQQTDGGEAPSRAGKRGRHASAGQRATERVLQSPHIFFSQDLVEKLVVWFSVNWPVREHPFTEESISDQQKLAAYLRALGFEMISEKKTSHPVPAAPPQRQAAALQHSAAVNKSDKEPKPRSLKRTPGGAEAQKPQSAPSDLQQISRLRNDISELKKRLEEQAKESDSLKKQIKQQSETAEKVAREHEEAVAAAVKKTEERMMEKIEEKKMEERARQLLEDPVDDDEETGDPSTCLEAMQGLECPERNFCISLIAQWLAPKWLVASKAAAIEECLFRYWCDRERDPKHEGGVKQVVGVRYRVRAKQLSMKMCPIGLSPLTHKSPMGLLPRDPSDEQVDELILSMEEHLLAAGEVRGKLWSGELDFATFVCDILIDNGLVPNQAPRTIRGDKVDRAAERNPAIMPAPAVAARG